MSAFCMMDCVWNWSSRGDGIRWGIPPLGSGDSRICCFEWCWNSRLALLAAAAAAAAATTGGVACGGRSGTPPGPGDGWMRMLGETTRGLGVPRVARTEETISRWFWAVAGLASCCHRLCWDTSPRATPCRRACASGRLRISAWRTSLTEGGRCCCCCIWLRCSILWSSSFCCCWCWCSMWCGGGAWGGMCGGGPPCWFSEICASNFLNDSCCWSRLEGIGPLPGPLRSADGVINLGIGGFTGPLFPPTPPGRPFASSSRRNRASNSSTLWIWPTFGATGPPLETPSSCCRLRFCIC
uniref:(northern house mosquito) hypothetical protein n=1 Tax=Culex pipiens TaxID=7175 RepID=A0A8D8HIE1_CULPI